MQHRKQVRADRVRIGDTFPPMHVGYQVWTKAFTVEQITRIGDDIEFNQGMLTTSMSNIVEVLR